MFFAMTSRGCFLSKTHCVVKNSDERKKILTSRDGLFVDPTTALLSDELGVDENGFHHANDVRVVLE